MKTGNQKQMGGFMRKGTYVYLWLIHADIWQKRTQYCKTIILQLKINKSGEKKEQTGPPSQWLSGKGFTCECRRHGVIPNPGRTHKVPEDSEQLLSPCATITEPGSCNY